MSNGKERSLELINRLRKRLDSLEDQLRSGHLEESSVSLIESVLVDQIARPNVRLNLTGPHGHDPKPVYEKCDECARYRLAK